MTHRKTLYVKVPTIDATKDEETPNHQQDPELKTPTGLLGRGRSRGRGRGKGTHLVFNQKNKAQTLQKRTSHNQVTSKIQYEVEIVTKIQTSTEATSQQPSTITQKEIITSCISQTSTTESEIIVPNRKIVNLKEVQTLTREEVCSMIHPYLPRDIIQQQFELGLDGTVVFNYLRNKGTDIPPQYTNFVWLGVTVLTEKRLFPFWNEEFTIRKLREKKIIKDVNTKFNVNDYISRIADGIYNNESLPLIREESVFLSSITDNKWELLVKFVTDLMTIEIIPFHYSYKISELLLELPKSFNQSKQRWCLKIQEAVRDQKGKLGSLFKQAILPDHYKGFYAIKRDPMLREWTYHFNELKIPENKGKPLIDLLSKDISVGRGNDFGYGIIPIIDLSTSGKTYTMFQLVNSIPTINYKFFFVIHIYQSSLFCEALIENIKSNKRPISELVASFVLTILITIKTLVETEPDIHPRDFLK
ncbi:predicted protein [Naegleria gruberi]|uniref:Predicted protein n=1 Tax=Naegleria gruberi TaxID=5762 RepID=D2VN30_NAEGR|nr:uncharacterized protein NAEGRDRAFT_70352 [Naegleria gruberi]EFC41848.1 predicted protein [Naegleria gruberi]|eukprot:XP_002674592.1 predicted protein [Naegleria gruberi strain NEG-M]